MSTELIKNVFVKDGKVYLNSKSKNDSLSFNTWECTGLTKVYEEGGQRALDIEIIMMLSEYCQIYGGNSNTIPYKAAIDEYYLTHSKRDNSCLDAAWNALSEDDRLSYYSETKTEPIKKYIEMEKNDRYKRYAEIADLLYKYR